MSIKIYFDGGCRPNPGRMEYAAVTRGVAYHETNAGFGDNNDAEWLALLHALRIGCELRVRDIVLLGDSALVVHQATGAWPCRRKTFQDHYLGFTSLVENFDRVTVRKIARSKNLAGHFLERVHGRL